MTTPQLQPGTYAASLAILARMGVRYATVIDIGCADAHFFVEHFVLGLFADAIPVNVDANAIYEPSLKEIQDIFGGHYLIAAASDSAGEVTLTIAAHPYWSSLRGPDDPYWDRINRLAEGVERVRAIRLDDVAVELGLKPPYLIKLDIQGAEVQALRGARAVLAETAVVIPEVDVDDFQAINGELAAAGFDLFDLTHLNRIADQSLGWFYPVYLNRKLHHLRERRIWGAELNADMIRAQAERRQEISAWYAEILPKIRAMRGKLNRTS